MLYAFCGIKKIIYLPNKFSSYEHLQVIRIYVNQTSNDYFFFISHMIEKLRR